MEWNRHNWFSFAERFSFECSSLLLLLMLLLLLRFYSRFNGRRTHSILFHCCCLFTHCFLLRFFFSFNAMLSFSHLQQAALFASLSLALSFLVSLTLSLSLCISLCICMYTVGCLHATIRTKRMNEWVSVRTQTARLWSSVCISNTLTDEGVQTKIHAFNHQQHTTTTTTKILQ